MSNSWRTARLGQIATIQTGIAKGKKPKKECVSVPYLRVANVQNGFLDLTEIKQIEVDPATVPRYLLRSGDVLFTEGGDYDKLGRGTCGKDKLTRASIRIMSSPFAQMRRSYSRSS